MHTALKVVAPKRKTDFICCEYEVPESLKWGHEKYMNTCTSDNFLTILLLYCKQHPQFICEALGDSESEDVLKAGVKLMLAGKIYEGRTLVLNLIVSKLNLEYVDEKYNCYGNEYDKCLCHIWWSNNAPLSFVPAITKK